MSLKNYSETYEYYNKEPYTGLSIYDKNKQQPIHKYVKVIQINNIPRFNRFVSGNLQIVVRKKDPNIESGSVEENLFDLDFEKKDGNFQYYVKPIGTWRMVKYVDGPMTLKQLQEDYFIYIHRGQLKNITEGKYESFHISDDNTTRGIQSRPGIMIGGKTRRRRSAKKASRKSRSNRKR